MTNTDHDDTKVEKFAPNGGTVIAVIGGIVVLVLVVGWALDMDGVPLWVPAASLFGGIVLYTSTVRPRVRVQGHELVLRNMLTTVHLPLAAIEEVAIQQVMAVRAGGKRYVCSGVGRTLRQAMKGSAMMRARAQMGGLRGELAAVHEPGMNYADFVEIRVQELINEDRMRRGVKKFSPEADELAGQVRREWAWPELVALVVTGVFFVVALLLGG
ncbi:MAG: hypothetical protein QOD98_2498 [Nocardioidaceae bacterium]|nr:hypothetical protein [Nocardioidaceae bacterium]